MSDLRGRMDAEAARVRAGDGALGSVMRRANRRRVVRRVGGTLVALTIAGGGIGLAYATFPFGNGDARPAVAPTAGPTPGPTPTGDHGTPAPVKVQLFNSSTRSDVLPYLTDLLHQGRGPHHGGYFVETISETEGSEVTVIIHAPGFEREAARTERLFFPGAELRIGDPDPLVPLRIVVGEDFAQRHADALEAFALVREFGAARADGKRADRFLGPDAATYYHGDDDASLYGYAKGCPYEVGGAEDPESPAIAEGDVDEFYLHFCRNHADSWTEIVRVGIIQGELRIVEAFLAVVSEG